MSEVPKAQNLKRRYSQDHTSTESEVLLTFCSIGASFTSLYSWACPEFNDDNDFPLPKVLTIFTAVGPNHGCALSADLGENTDALTPPQTDRLVVDRA